MPSRILEMELDDLSQPHSKKVGTTWDNPTEQRKTFFTCKYFTPLPNPGPRQVIITVFSVMVRKTHITQTAGFGTHICDIISNHIQSLSYPPFLCVSFMTIIIASRKKEKKRKVGKYCKGGVERRENSF